MILGKYNGEKFIHNTCKVFIIHYNSNQKYINEMFQIIAQTGSVIGEYGFVNALKEKKKHIQSWKKLKNKKINDFVEEYEKYLDKRIENETKKADEFYELNKRNLVW